MDLCYTSTVHLHTSTAISTVTDVILAPLALVVSQYLGQQQRRESDVFDTILFIAENHEEIVTDAKILAYIFQVQAPSRDHTNLLSHLLYVFWQFYASLYNHNLVSASAS